MFITFISSILCILVYHAGENLMPKYEAVFVAEWVREYPDTDQIYTGEVSIFLSNKEIRTWQTLKFLEKLK